MRVNNLQKSDSRIGLYTLFLTVLLLTLSLTGFVQNGYSASESAMFVVDRMDYTVNGKMMTMDAVPFIENGRVYVPVRFLAESVGVAPADIGWNAASREVTLKKGDVTVSMKIGSTTLMMNGGTVMMDTAPMIRSDRTCLPARYVAEAFGFNVGWNDMTRSVTVSREVVMPKTHTVELSGFQFSPAALTIRAGDTVVWTNRDNVQHTVTFPDFGSPLFGNGGTYTHTFDKAGTFSYYCIPHPRMVGTITVQ